VPIAGAVKVQLLRLIALASAVLAFGAPTASAKVCADYPNQAAAQRAHDTRDADGDGIYCESLPCPCLKPGRSTPAPTPVPPAPEPLIPLLGPSQALGPMTKRAGCRVRGALPDPACTPGARFSRATKAEVCRRGYASSVRNVSTAEKDAVYREYGFDRHFDGADGEVDHLISLELGGSNAEANLFPEAASPRPGSHEKDRLENELHSEVCAGRISLRRAQRLIATNWLAAYRARFGNG
jgi:hypothetical protein